MPPAQLEQAQRLAESGAEAQADSQSFLGQGASYAGVSLPDGTRCVLSYQILPQFASKELRDALPNPQNILLAAFALGSVAIVAGLAVRASRVIERKMRPLVEAAAHIERQDLDFPVPASNVRQINRVLGAMERMRASLKSRSKRGWRAEEAQRAQVAALAHDLKNAPHGGAGERRVSGGRRLRARGSASLRACRRAGRAPAGRLRAAHHRHHPGRRVGRRTHVPCSRSARLRPDARGRAPGRRRGRQDCRCAARPPSRPWRPRRRWRPTATRSCARA